MLNKMINVFPYIRKGFVEVIPNYFWPIFGISCIALFAILRKNGKKQLTVSKSLSVAVLVSYIFLLFCSAIFLRDYEVKARYNLNLFWTYKLWLLEGKNFLPEIVGNIVIMIPIGFLLPELWDYRKKRKLFKLVSTLFVGIMMSFMIEVLQYFLHRGLADIDDILNNTIGIIIGALCYFIIMVIGCIILRCKRKMKYKE